ncbi:MAG: ferrous iron transport protein A [Ignavibacteriaceae bacterium]
MKKASELNFGEKAIITDIDCSKNSSRRILEVGFTPGEEIQLVNKSIFNDPMAFSVRGSLIAIRKDDADCIIIS